MFGLESDASKASLAARPAFPALRSGGTSVREGPEFGGTGFGPEPPAVASPRAAVPRVD